MPGQEITYTAVPPGTGLRLGIDRDRDGVLDRDELDAGTDPADPSDAGVCQALAVKAATFRNLTALAGQQSLSLRANFPGVFAGEADDVMRVTVSTNLGPLVDATLDNSRGFHGRGGGASYSDSAGVNQHVTWAALHAVRGPAVRFTMRLAKAPLAGIASASSLNVAVHVYSPSTGVHACAQVTGVPCQLNPTGTVLSCSS